MSEWELKFQNPDVDEFLHKQFGDRWKKLCRALATPPLESIARVSTRLVDVGKALGKVKECVSNAKVVQLHPPPPPVHVHELFDDVIVVQGSGPHEEGVKKMDWKQPWVILDHGCGMAVARGADAFSPGVKGIGPRKTTLRVGSIVEVFVDADNCFLKGSKDSMEESTGRFVSLGRGRLMMNRFRIFAEGSKGVAVTMVDPVWRLTPFTALQPRVVFLQNLPSIVAARSLQVAKGDRILEICSAPGGKASLLGQLIAELGEGSVIALERNKGKVKREQALLAELGLETWVEVQCMDATKADQSFVKQSFRKVLLDPPCSGLGNRPMLRNKIALGSILGMPKYQKKMVDVAYQLLMPSGIMVYSTCTINGYENEGVIAHAVQTGFKVMDPVFPDLGSEGMVGFGLDEKDRMRVRRFDPVEGGSTIGFFVARLQKKDVVVE